MTRYTPRSFFMSLLQARRATAMVVLCAGIVGSFFATFALVHMQVETLTVHGDKMVVRASSCLQGPRVFSLANLFDNDSSSCWIEGEADSLSGRWFDISYEQQKRFKGIIFGLGCRKDYQSLAEFGIPTGIRVKFDEKDDVNKGVGWEWGNDGLMYSGVNMQQAVLWFDSDTAFTTTKIRVKFTSVSSGRRYLNVAVSDVEPIDAFDSRFELLPILVSRSFNPNDLGVVYAHAVPQTSGEQQWIGQTIDSISRSARFDNPADMAAAINAAFNAPTEAITDNDAIVAYVASLRKTLVSGAQMPRFVFDGRKASYLVPVGSLRVGKMRLDVWRNISTQRSSKGLEVTIGFVAFAV